jgi:hypothetical protein
MFNFIFLQKHNYNMQGKFTSRYLTNIIWQYSVYCMKLILKSLKNFTLLCNKTLNMVSYVFHIALVQW